MTSVLLLLWVLDSCFGQPATSELPERVRKVADSALAAPPELAADILIRLAGSRQVTSKQAKLELLERAFALAGSARYPVGLRSSASWTDNREWALAEGLRFGLSANSLRIRVLKEMAPLDGQRARLHFAETHPPAIALTCKDTLIPLTASHYALLPMILAQGFTAEERKKDADLAWIADQIRAMNSPMQLEEMVRLLIDQTWSRDRMEFLLTAYSGVMKQMEADARTSSFALNFGLQQRMFELTRKLLQMEISPLPLLDAYRTLLVRTMRGTRCVRQARSSDPYEELRKMFNNSLRKLMPQGLDLLAEITKEDARPTGEEPAGTAKDFWTTELSKPLLAGLRRLRFGTEEQQAVLQKEPQRKPGEANWLSVDQRRAPEWEDALRALLLEVERWKKDPSETEADHFHQLMMIHHTLLEITPAGDLRGEVLAAAISTLKTSSLETTSPPDWYFQFRRLLLPRDGGEEERRARREEVRRAGDAVMTVYADLEELAPSK